MIRFVLEDTGERRVPCDEEHYFLVARPVTVHNGENTDPCEYTEAPEAYGILKLSILREGY
jgi:hypothetical protein